MSKVEQIQGEIQKLTAEELHQIRDWLDDFFEDQLQFTPEFEAKIQQSEKEMSTGRHSRVRDPNKAQ